MCRESLNESIIAFIFPFRDSHEIVVLFRDLVLSSLSK